MDRWYEQIRRAIREDRIVFSVHADNQLAARGVLRWQAVVGFEYGALQSAHPHSRPNPKVRVRQMLPDGQEVIAVWAYVRSIDCAKLVTIFFED